MSCMPGTDLNAAGRDRQSPCSLELTFWWVCEMGVTMETNKQDNLWDSDECSRGKNRVLWRWHWGTVGKGWHPEDRKMPFMSQRRRARTLSSGETWTVQIQGFELSVSSGFLLKRRQQCGCLLTGSPEGYRGLFICVILRPAHPWASVS